MPEAPDMQDVAIHASLSAEGVSRLFDNVDYATHDACKKAAISLRNRFYTFKAKIRRQQKRRFGIDTTPYDDLTCFVDETPTGWRLRICKSSTDIGTFVDAQTGEPIKALEKAAPSLKEVPHAEPTYEEKMAQFEEWRRNLKPSANKEDLFGPPINQGN